MDYDKNSFLAGMSVGRTLKGWAGGGSFGSGSAGAAIVLQFGDLSFSPLEFGSMSFTDLSID